MNGPCRLQGADLGYARFTNAMLQELQLEGAKATGASFDNSKICRIRVVPVPYGHLPLCVFK